MPSQRRDDCPDGISARRMPSGPPEFEPPRRREYDDDYEPRRSDGFPLAPVLVLGGVGLLMIMSMIVGIFFWLALEAAPEPMAVAPPMAVDIQQDAPWMQNDFPRPQEQPPWFEQIAPFVEKQAELRGPFESHGPLLTIDLKNKINWKHDEAIDLGGNDMGDLPMGQQVFAGIRFNVQGGAILLGGRLNPPSGRPLEVHGIKVNAKCKKLYALQTAHYTTGKGEIGGYLLRYEDGERAVLPIVFGEDVSDWFFGMIPPVERSRQGWSGRNGASGITFYVTRYVNPHPEKTIASIDFYASNAGAAPVCVALTMEQ